MIASLSTHYRSFHARVTSTPKWLSVALIGVGFTVAGLYAVILIGAKYIR